MASHTRSHRKLCPIYNFHPHFVGNERFSHASKTRLRSSTNDSSFFNVFFPTSCNDIWNLTFFFLQSYEIMYFKYSFSMAFSPHHVIFILNQEKKRLFFCHLEHSTKCQHFQTFHKKKLKIWNFSSKITIEFFVLILKNFSSKSPIPVSNSSSQFPCPRPRSLQRNLFPLIAFIYQLINLIHLICSVIKSLASRTVHMKSKAVYKIPRPRFTIIII